MTALYVHVPFCVKKCPYCAFYSVALAPNGKEDKNRSVLIRKYLEGIRKEISLRRQDAPGGVSSLFIGGGTPSVLDEGELKELLILIGEIAGRNDGRTERTIECNPGTINEKKAQILQAFGINRVSLGVQALDDGFLKEIGRIHGVKQVEEAVKIIRGAGIDNLNLDLMFGLPGQTMEKWFETLEKAIAFKPQHLSLYALTLEEETPFGREYGSDGAGKANVCLPDDDLQADMYEGAVELLETAGYARYEISNFALPGYECRHNLSYWRGDQYLGLGPGAVSCLKGVRSKNIDSLDQYNLNLAEGYARQAQAEDREYLTEEQMISEFMMLGLRTAEGIAFETFYGKFQRNIEDIYREFLAEYMQKGYLLADHGRLKLNPQYFFVANAVLTKFML
ncbi:oxygen-independent coproporphyrinogen III oxidase [Syntrophobotulus glycolicus DSM 8271]|uniref:Heme chaperone HemW n=1 Tax=Syntrophobotulus glycolicus (strain DSM 8271 / FlGlyR) TaxID=645991 RepID=F0SVF2_SYNGF|nr:radical SAM family heme chaperone HemW [Syntrophobotulus glycolicus]ADY56725.1 oxygen-independent coproporphyrinogen III oxidase [Syntrophobotulus glycolicus DSM 8271]